MKPFIVANWKMNPMTLSEAKRLFNLAKKGVRNIKNVEVIICPPFVYLPVLRASVFARPSASFGGLAFGSQNCFWEEKGAFTGEVSPKMLKNLGCQYVIVGHSERRKYQEETDEMINKKIKAALKAGLKPILCIDKISQIPKDIKPRFFAKGRGKIENLIIAYEPLFAIGSGNPCSTERARKMNFSIKKILGPKIPILYGGSINPQNAEGYIKEAGFDGLLIGGASLNAREFIAIIKAVSRQRR